MESFRVAVRRQAGEGAPAWRERAAAEARAQAASKGLVVQSIELSGARGSPMVGRAHSGVIEVTVRGKRVRARGESA